MMNNSTKVDFESCVLFGCFDMPAKIHINNEYLNQFYALLKTNMEFCNLSRIPKCQHDMGTVKLDIIGDNYADVTIFGYFCKREVSFLCKYDENSYVALFCEKNMDEPHEAIECIDDDEEYHNCIKVTYNIKDMTFYDVSCIDEYMAKAHRDCDIIMRGAMRGS